MCCVCCVCMPVPAPAPAASDAAMPSPPRVTRKVVPKAVTYSPPPVVTKPPVVFDVPLDNAKDEDAMQRKRDSFLANREKRNEVARLKREAQEKVCDGVCVGGVCDGVCVCVRARLWHERFASVSG